DPPLADGDDLRLLLLDHLSVVGISRLRSRPLDRHAAPLLIVVGKRHNLGLRDFLPGHIDAVPVIAPPGAANDRHAVGVGHGVLLNAGADVTRKGCFEPPLYRPASRSRGSVASWTPSPMRLYARTARKIARPGNRISHQRFMFCRPEFRSVPQLGL